MKNVTVLNPNKTISIISGDSYSELTSNIAKYLKPFSTSKIDAGKKVIRKGILVNVLSTEFEIERTNNNGYIINKIN